MTDFGEFSDLVDNNPQNAGSVDDHGEFSDLVAEANAPETGAGGHHNALGQLQSTLQGFYGGWGDKLASAAVAAPTWAGRNVANAGLNMVAGADMPYEGLGDVYDEVYGAYHGNRAAFEQENPVLAMASNITGMLLNPVLRGKAAAGSPAWVQKGAQVMNQMGKVKQGAVIGGAYSAGESEADNPLEFAKDTAIGTGVGALAPVVLDKTVVPAAKWVGGKIAPYAKEAGNAIADQINKFSGGAEPIVNKFKTATAPILSPAEKLIADRMGNVNHQAVINHMTARENMGLPVSLAEATGNPKLVADAKAVTRMSEGGGVPAQFFRDRAETQTPAMVTKMLDKVSPSDTTTGLSEKIIDGADSIVTKMEKDYAEKLAPAYREVFADTRLLNSKSNKKLLQDPRMIDAIKKARYTYGIDPNLPDNSLEVLHRAKGMISDVVEASKRSGDKAKARAFSDLYGDLQTKLGKTFPDYAKITEMARAEILKMNNVPPAIGIIADLKGGSVREAGSKIFELEPQQIQQLRVVFKNSGKQEQFNAGVRAYLQDTFESMRQGTATNRIGATDYVRQQMQAALGKREGDGLYKMLDAMSDAQAFSRTVAGNSETAYQIKAVEGLEEGLQSNKTKAVGLAAKPFNAVNRLYEKMSGIDLVKNSEEYAKLMFTSDGKKLLRKLSRIPVRDTKIYDEIGNFFAKPLAQTAGDAVTQE